MPWNIQVEIHPFYPKQIPSSVPSPSLDLGGNQNHRRFQNLFFLPKKKRKKEKTLWLFLPIARFFLSLSSFNPSPLTRGWKSKLKFFLFSFMVDFCCGGKETEREKERKRKIFRTGICRLYFLLPFFLAPKIKRRIRRNRDDSKSFEWCCLSSRSQ